MDTRSITAAITAACKVLKDQPPYTPKLIKLRREEVALVMLGGDLALLRKAGPPVVNFQVWCERPQGPRVVAVAFRVSDDPQDPLEGEIYLNPYDRHDLELIDRLSGQEDLSLFFFSADFCNVVSKRVPLPEDLRRKVWGVRNTVPDDKAKFDEARSSFQFRYTVKDILDGKPGTEFLF